MADEQTTGRPLSDRETNDLVGKIQSVLTPDLLEPKYRKQSEGQHPTFGHCASATQAAYYMLGGKKSGYVPQVAKEDDGTTHWWLRHRQTGHVIDPTKEQYTSQGEKPPYDLGRGCGFPNPNPDAPSRRGQEIIDRISGKPFRQAKASGGPIENQDIASPAPAEDEGITAYHGSPYEFERFDTSKIGTGEGAQAYGHGLYFAEHEPVAKEYRDKLSPGSALLDLPPKGDAQRQVLSQLKELGDEGFVYSIDDLKSFVRGSSSYNEPEMMTAFNRLAARAKEKNPGHMYEVKIKANPDHFLDWDKQISKQSEKVQAVLRDMLKSAKKSFEQIDLSGNPTGGQVHHLYSQHRGGNNKSVSEYLLQNGIPGIKYFDSGSRNEEDGTRNYVVFDDKLLDIKRRYEMGGAVPMASGGEAGDTQSMPQLTSEQQSLLDQLSRAIDRVYPAMDAAEARQPVIRHEPTMPGEPALTTEQHQEYNIGQLQNALARIPTDYPTGPVGYAEGGSLRKGISDWKWKPLSRVRESIGVSEIPSHVQDFGKFMDETANKASGEGLSVRDLIKAYTITRSSIRRAARKADTVRNAGLNIPDSITGMVRPEGAFGHWLHTSYGQNYLNDAEKGRVNEDAIKDAVRIMRPFGGQNQLVDALTWAVNNLPGQEKKFSELVSRAQQMQSSPSEWRELVKPIKGIRESKAGFMASMIGRGDQPTLDARQIVLHTGRPSDEASKYLSRSGAGASAVDRLARRQKALDLTIPQNLSPYYQHLAHHTIWDKVGNEITTHQDVIDAMRGAASGGAISSSILSHPVASAMRALGFKGIDGEESNLKKNESGVVSRALMLTSKKA